MKSLSRFREEPGFYALVFAIFCLGAALRFYLPLTTEYFVNDGGLHLLLARELLDNSFVPPKYTSYNLLDIPFVYPPLSTYVTAGLQAFFGISIETSLHYLPALMSCAVLAASYLFLQQICTSRFSLLVSFVVVATIPHAFLQLVKGGGISRSLGALFAILVMRQVCLMFWPREGKPGNEPYLHPGWISAGVLLGLTFLSHPEWALAALLFVLSALLVDRSLRGLLSVAGAGAIAALVALPWGLVVFINHGLTPILSALDYERGSEGIVRLVSLRVFQESMDPFIYSLGYIGLAICLIRKRYIVPAFVALLALFMARGHSFIAYLPFAHLVGEGGGFLLIGAFRLYPDRVSPYIQEDRALRILFSIVIALSLAQAFPVLRSTGFATSSLSVSEADAFAWIKENTSTDARFIIVSGASWWSDHTNEIFPVLTGRHSVTTCQGMEWLPGGVFSRCVASTQVLTNLVSKEGLEKLANLMDDHGSTYLLVMKKAVFLPAVEKLLPPNLDLIYHNSDCQLYFAR